MTMMYTTMWINSGKMETKTKEQIDNELEDIRITLERGGANETTIEEAIKLIDGLQTRLEDMET